jgi:hypothetical protein
VGRAEDVGEPIDVATRRVQTGKVGVLVLCTADEKG